MKKIKIKAPVKTETGENKLNKKSIALITLMLFSQISSAQINQLLSNLQGLAQSLDQANKAPTKSPQPNSTQTQTSTNQTGAETGQPITRTDALCDRIVNSNALNAYGAKMRELHKENHELADQESRQGLETKDSLLSKWIDQQKMAFFGISLVGRQKYDEYTRFVIRSVNKCIYENINTNASYAFEASDDGANKTSFRQQAKRFSGQTSGTRRIDESGNIVTDTPQKSVEFFPRADVESLQYGRVGGLKYYPFLALAFPNGEAILGNIAKERVSEIEFTIAKNTASLELAKQNRIKAEEEKEKQKRLAQQQDEARLELSKQNKIKADEEKEKEKRLAHQREGEQRQQRIAFEEQKRKETEEKFELFDRNLNAFINSNKEILNSYNDCIREEARYINAEISNLKKKADQTGTVDGKKKILDFSEKLRSSVDKQSKNQCNNRVYTGIAQSASNSKEHKFISDETKIDGFSLKINDFTSAGIKQISSVLKMTAEEIRQACAKWVESAVGRGARNDKIAAGMICIPYDTTGTSDTFKFLQSLSSERAR